MSLQEHSSNGSTNCISQLDIFQEKIWFIFVLQSVLAVVGNGFAIYRFVVRERQWHTGIVYVFNLTVSDLLYAFSLLPIASYYYPPKDWKYGAVFCKLDRFLFFCNFYGSTFFVACISLNRYVAIVHPFFAHSRLETRHAKLVSGAVWLLVMTISAPVFTFSILENSSENNISRTICLGSASRAELPKYWPYSLFLAAFGCGLPFFLTAFSCMAIVCTVIHSHGLTAEEKFKVKALVGMVVVLYAIFYLPFHVLRNLNLHNRMHKNLHDRMHNNCNVFVYDFYQMAKILVNFHICIHPMVYAALTDSLQKYCFRCFRWRKEMHEEEKNVEMRLPSQIPQD